MTNTTPIIQVSHLPSAASFYASLTQPLGLRYLSATPVTPATLHFGRIVANDNTETKEILFSLAQASGPNPPITEIYFAAPSPKSVVDFYTKSKALNPSERGHLIEPTEDGGERAATRDLDGNMLEAVYSSRRARSHVPTLETASTEKEARRVLEWQKDVARSVSAGDGHSQVSSGTQEILRSYPRGAPKLVTRHTVTTEHYDHDPIHTGSLRGAPIPQQDSSGMSGKAIIGTILGAAAGAAAAYAMVRSESPENTHQPSPPTGRRASFAGLGGTFTHVAPPAPVQRVVEMEPARSYAGSRGETARPRYVQYTIAAPHPGITRSHTFDGSPSHALQRIEERSHVSHRSGRSHHGSTRERSRSEHGSRFNKPLTIMPAPRDESPGTHVSHRSHKSHRSHHSSSSSGEKSHHTSKSKSHAPSHVSESKSHHTSKSHVPSHVLRSKSHHSSHSTKAESYTSAKSHRSESTVKAAPSRTSTTTIKIVGRDGERDVHGYGDSGEKRSYISAREVPLPRSVISGVSARDIPLPRSMVSGVGYAASVAPSDSVSSVGSKRERERLRERMGMPSW